MIIADSGSTKTTWRLVKETKEIVDISTEGINPYFQTKDDIEQILYTQLLPNVEPDWISALTEVHYYGAGCSSPEKVEIVESAIRNCLPKSKVKVDHDLLASARALLGNTKGIACILGTGSNSCLYDGKEVIENVPSWGYMFGDFGSGAHIGKQLLQAYANDELNLALKERLESQGVQREVILNSVYKRPLPNRYLASFAKLAHSHIQDEQVNKVVEECFETFFKYQVEKYTNYKEYKVSFVGSVAFHFSKQLQTAATKRGISIGQILKEPIEGLTEFHLV
jgi:N-acetylglucosamine kinase-like BadF-type ATPase